MISNRKLALVITALGALSFLFVVVCPLTSTPAALPGCHGSQVSGAGTTASPMVAPASQLIIPLSVAPSGSIATATALQLPHSPHPGHGQLIDLTCARLC